MTAPLVLVVDDNSQAGRASCELLRAAGFDAAMTLTPEGTLTFFRHGLRVDVAAIDLMLGGMDGNQLAAKLRELAPDMKIVIVTGYPIAVQPPTRAIVEEVVQKPIQGSELLDAVRRALGTTNVEKRC
jgi:FixJ family two-component response regulator